MTSDEGMRRRARQLYVTQRQAICRAGNAFVPTAGEIERAFDAAYPPLNDRSPAMFGWQVRNPAGRLSYLYPETAQEQALELALQLGTRPTRVEVRDA